MADSYARISDNANHFQLPIGFFHRRFETPDAGRALVYTAAQLAARFGPMAAASERTRIMKVSRVGGSKDAAASKKAKKGADGETASFADSLRETQAAQGAQVAGEAAAVPGVDAVLTAQSVGDQPDDRPARRRLMEYGDEILDRLDELRLGILSGTFSKERLADLAQKLRQKRNESKDPRLNEIIQEIELRAEVEIAKFSRRV